MERIIDFQAHVLPGETHRAEGIGPALRKLEDARQAGVTEMVAAPRFSVDRYPGVTEFLEWRDYALEQLLNRYSGPVRIFPAAEVQVCRGLRNLPGVGKLCISGTRTLLVELPDGPWPAWAGNELAELERERGVRIILAHVDRYPAKWVEPLLRSGFCGQINAEGLCSPLHRRRLTALAGTPLIAALGSGCGEGHYRNFAQALRILGSQASLLMERTAELL